MIYTTYPYFATEEDFVELEKAGIERSIEHINIQLDFNDLPRKYGRESETHRAMKKFAYQMLKHLGENEPQYEYAGFDVFAPALKIIVECGDIPLGKLYDAFFRWLNVDLKEMWMLDYPQNGVSELVKFFRKNQRGR